MFADEVGLDTTKNLLLMRAVWKASQEAMSELWSCFAGARTQRVTWSKRFLLNMSSQMMSPIRGQTTHYSYLFSLLLNAPFHACKQLLTQLERLATEKI